MKARKEIRIPLSDAVLTVLSKMDRTTEFVFPGVYCERLCGQAMERVLKRMKRPVTVHGFRSTFKDWAAEVSPYATALAHTIGGVEGAYQRGDLLEKRRRLMSDWAAFCFMAPAEGDNVVQLRA
jgi:integrase